MIDPKQILYKHLAELRLTTQERRDIEATFHRFVELTGEAVMGANVDGELRQVEAQIKLWKSGAMSATQAALWNAASEYAAAAGKVIGQVITKAVGGLL